MGEIHVNPQDPNSIKIDTDQEKAQIIADYFSSVFTREPNIPVLSDRNVPHEMREVER